MGTNDGNHTMCMEFYFLQQNAFISEPAGRAALGLVQVPCLSEGYGKSYGTVPLLSQGCPGKHNSSPGTCDPCSTSISACCKQPTSKVHTRRRWRGGRKRCEFLASVLYTHAKKTRSMDGCSQGSCNFHHPLLGRTQSQPRLAAATQTVRLSPPSLLTGFVC